MIYKLSGIIKDDKVFLNIHNTNSIQTNTKSLDDFYDDITLQKDKKTINVYIINASGNAKELKDCNIGGISVYGSNKNAPEFSIAKGIKVGDKEDKVREAFGSPTDTSNYDEYNSLRYGEDNSITTIVCDNGTDEYNDAQIEIKNFVATEDDKKTKDFKKDYRVL